MKLEELTCISENIDIDKYIDFREEVKKNMEYPDWLGDFSKKDLINTLENGSKIWLYYLNDDYDLSEDNRVKVTLYGKIIDENIVKYYLKRLT